MDIFSGKTAFGSGYYDLGISRLLSAIKIKTPNSHYFLIKTQRKHSDDSLFC